VSQLTANLAAAILSWWLLYGPDDAIRSATPDDVYHDVSALCWVWGDQDGSLYFRQGFRPEDDLILWRKQYFYFTDHEIFRFAIHFLVRSIWEVRGLMQVQRRRRTIGKTTLNGIAGWLEP
jgi:hypothetical protein